MQDANLQPWCKLAHEAKLLSRLQKQLINHISHCITGCKEYIFHRIYNSHLGKNIMHASLAYAVGLSVCTFHPSITSREFNQKLLNLSSHQANNTTG